MRSFWSDPYLWIHLAGAAMLPLTLELCLLGFAIGDPIFPPLVERLLVLTVGIVPIFLMQWQRPFYIFSLLFVAIQPEYLTLDQRRILQRFKTPGQQLLTVLVAIVLGALLLQIYQLAPLVLESANSFPQWRGLGLLIAAGGFFLSNLFLQVPLSVLRVMLMSEAEFAATGPYAIEQIRPDFSIFGWKVKQIVPPLTEAQTLAMAAAVAAAPARSPAPPAASSPAPVQTAPPSDTATSPTEAEPSTDESTNEPALADLIAPELVESAPIEAAETPSSTEIDTVELLLESSTEAATEASIEPLETINSEPTTEAGAPAENLSAETVKDQPESESTV